MWSLFPTSSLKKGYDYVIVLAKSPSRGDHVMARPKKNLTGEGAQTPTGEGAQSTGSSGNARHRAQKRTLSGEIRQMNAKLDRILDQSARIARGVS